MSDHFLVLISGGSGAGKTTLADIIEEDIGPEKVLRISTDRFYRNFENPQEANYDHPDSIDWKLFQGKIHELLHNGTVEIPVYSFEKHARNGFEKVESKQVIIVEGIFGLVNEEINDMASLRIFVETDADIRFIRRLTRDVEERGRTKQGVIDQWLEQVKPMHEEFIEPSKRNAHIIVPEDPDGNMRETARELIKSRIESFLED